MSEHHHPALLVDRLREKPAMVMIDSGATLTYGEMVSGANKVAHLLQRLGVRTGDTIAIFMENGLYYPQLCWAAENSGLYYVCIPKGATSSELAYLVSNSGAKILFTSDTLAPVARQARGQMDPALTIFSIGQTEEGFRCLFSEMSKEPDGLLLADRRGEVMLYSSGTTGTPKGIRAPLSEESPLVAPARHRFLTGEYGLSGDSVVLDPGPLYHATPIKFLLHAHRAGGTVLCVDKFNAELALRAIQTHRATMAVVVPTMMVRMLKLPVEVRRDVDTSSLKCVVHQAAPCPIDIKSAFIEWMGPICFDLYGGSEANGTVSINSQDWLTHKGSVGRPTAGTEIHVLNAAGEECKPFEPGLIYLWNGRRFEYHGDPQKTAEAHHEKGWSTLGDIGYLDQDGYLYLTDRKSNMIIRGGVNIYPAEIEGILVSHPEVADAAVLGVPDEDLGEEVTALVVLQRAESSEQERSRLSDELIRFCKSRLNSVKCPRSIKFVSEIPRSEAGKILKQQLREREAVASVRNGGNAL